MSAGKILLGVLAGIAAGATLGILFAPAKGSKTRKKIIEKGDEYADGLNEHIYNLANTVNDKIEHLKEDAMKMAEMWKTQAKEAKTNSNNAPD